METSEVSEFKILEWIGRLGSPDIGEKMEARKRLISLGGKAVEWLVYSYNEGDPSAREIALVLRKISEENGMPRRGRKEIRRIMASIA